MGDDDDDDAAAAGELIVALIIIADPLLSTWMFVRPSTATRREEVEEEAEEEAEEEDVSPSIAMLFFPPSPAILATTLPLNACRFPRDKMMLPLPWRGSAGAGA